MESLVGIVDDAGSRRLARQDRLDQGGGVVPDRDGVAGGVRGGRHGGPGPGRADGASAFVAMRCWSASTTAARPGPACATPAATRTRSAACSRAWAGSRPPIWCSSPTPTAARSIARSSRCEGRLRAGAQAGLRRELIVYYSGHSDEDGLLHRPRPDRLRRSAARVERTPANLRVVILDSCGSGAFTPPQGGRAPGAVPGRHVDRHARATPS